MTLTIQIPDELAIAIQAKAQAEGLSPDGYVGRVLEQMLDATAAKSEATRLPLKTSYGILAKYGPGPSAEEIDQARKELWGYFPRD